MATHSSILAWKIPIHGVAKESDMTGQLNKNKSSDADMSFCKYVREISFLCDFLSNGKKPPVLVLICSNKQF